MKKITSGTITKKDVEKLTAEADKTIDIQMKIYALTAQLRVIQTENRWLKTLPAPAFDQLSSDENTAFCDARDILLSATKVM